MHSMHDQKRGPTSILRGAKVGHTSGKVPREVEVRNGQVEPSDRVRTSTRWGVTFHITEVLCVNSRRNDEGTTQNCEGLVRGQVLLSI